MANAEPKTEVRERPVGEPVAPVSHPEEARGPVALAPAPLARGGDWDASLRRKLAAADAGAAVLALAVALTLSGRESPDTRLLWGLIVAPLSVVLFKVYGLYDRDVKRINYSTVDDLPRVLHATVVEALVLWLYSKLTPMHRMDFTEVLGFGLLAIGLTMSFRAAVRSYEARSLGQEPALLIGGGELAEMLNSKLAAHPEYRAKVVGVLTDDPSAPARNGPPVLSPHNGLPVLGSIADLETIVREHRIGRVIVSSGHSHDRHELEEVLRRCRGLSLKFSLLPELSDVLGPAVEIDDVEGVTLLGVNPPWLPRSSRALKRSVDLLIASALLILSAPLIAVIALAVKLDSPGPVLFTQERVGRGGRRFRVHKFRTMSVDAERRRSELLEQSTDPDWLKLEKDPRITRLGRHLRRLSLDELPQLWNVLSGEMSMVGPRPLIPAEDERVLGWARGRLDLTPGITGYWQVLGRTRIPFEEMVKLDYLYVMNWTLWEDVRLMLRTLPAVIGGRGAN